MQSKKYNITMLGVYNCTSNHVKERPDVKNWSAFS